MLKEYDMCSTWKYHIIPLLYTEYLVYYRMLGTAVDTRTYHSVLYT